MSSVRKRTLPSGEVRWLVDYLDQAGKRRAKQFQTKKEAIGFETRARSEVAQGTHTPDSCTTTVADAARLWLERCENDGLERGTVKSYRAHVDIHIVPRIGTERLSRLTVPGVERFKDSLLADISRPLTRKVMVSLSSILTEAQRRGLVAQNVARGIKVKVQSRGGQRPEMPSKAELNAMLDGAEGRWRPLIIVAVFCGLRGSELRGLQWSDIDLKGRALTVSGRVDEWGQRGPPKSEAGHRSIPLAPMVVTALREWKLACPVSETGLVFSNGLGKPESHANILNRFFWPLQKKLGIVDAAGEPKYSLHALRHACAALMIEEGLSPKKVQTIMGHANITMTFDTYGYLFDDRDEDAARAASLESRLRQR